MESRRIPFQILMALAIGLPTGLRGQERATTEAGQRVLLYSDGTWKPDLQTAGPDGPGATFRRPAAATGKREFNRGAMALFYNPKLWKEAPAEDVNRVQFRHKDGDGYVLVLAERMDVPLETLKKVALANAAKAAPDAQVVHEERRTVNGREVLYLQIEGTIQGIAFVYHGYYYGGKEGCIQVIGYTSRNLIKEYRPDILDLLNGLTIH